jgi:hypothetical protein
MNGKVLNTLKGHRQREVLHQLDLNQYTYSNKCILILLITHLFSILRCINNSTIMIHQSFLKINLF